MAFKKIGVLGGMGPESSANFYYKLIKYCQKKYHEVQDTDYPPMIIYSLPLDGFDEGGIVNEVTVLKQLIQGIKTLEKADCDFIVMPCNTIHYFFDELNSICSVPIISIIEETAKKIKQKKYNVVGLLASETTLNLQIYQKALNQKGIQCLTPTKEEELIITKLILEIMGGKVTDCTKNEAKSIIKKMEQQSAQAIVLGCTEIPLVINQKDAKIKVYDTLQILAEAAVNYSMN